VAQVLLVPAAATTNPPSTFFSLHTGPQADVLVQNELPNYVHPARVRRQIVVELVRDLVQFGEARPRHSREVVVLVVQSNVVREEVEHAVVRVCLRDRDLVRCVQSVLVGLLEYVVLCDEVSGTRVQRACQEAAQDHVSDRLSTNEPYERVIEDELGDDVEQVNLGQRELVDEHGAEGVEEDLEGAEEGFSADGVEEQGFEGSGEVGVEAVDAERFVVSKVVGLHRVSLHAGE
jgi:hypothetical protein